MENAVLQPTAEGTPQGGIVSPALANFTRDGREGAVTEAHWMQGNKVHLVRYADDCILTGSTKEVLEKEVKPLVERFLTERG